MKSLFCIRCIRENRLFCSRTTIAILDFLFPPKCMACGSFFSRLSHGKAHGPSLEMRHHDTALNPPSDTNIRLTFYEGMNTILCGTCLEAFSPYTSPFCSRCGFIFKSREGDNHVCQECIDSPKRFEIARSAGTYDLALMRLIHQFKYRGRAQLSERRMFIR